MPDLGIVVVLALAAFRGTQLVVGDKITAPLRDRIYALAWDDNRPVVVGDKVHPTCRGPWRAWLHSLVTCYWCVGLYAAAAAYALWEWGGSVAHGFLVVGAIAGAQGFLASVTAVLGAADDELGD